MSKFDEVTRVLKDLPAMTEDRAMLMRDLMRECGAKEVLELGTMHGKSAAYIAAILADDGIDGHVTTIDLASSVNRPPSALTTLSKVGLEKYLVQILARRSHTWEMAKMLKTSPTPQFDFCYFDGGHTWDITGFGLLLVDMLLKPGGIIVVDDLNWTINKSVAKRPQSAATWVAYSDDEKESPGVRMAFDLICPRLGYKTNIHKGWPWGIARKPL